uniref:Uncharacterized protein n=1 Tax=Anguilla anguilla TaxID=7936 RepID=A0A0E9TI80_ANGAN
MIIYTQCRGFPLSHTCHVPAHASNPAL